MQSRLVVCSLLSLSTALAAAEYVIGIEQLDYYPHYDFKSVPPRGYFYDLIQLYSQWSGDRFSFAALPVKRLYADSVELTDFVYPDNQAWQPHLEVDPAHPKTFSAPVIYTLGSTMVKPEKQAMTMADFKLLANIHGFSPTLWVKLKANYKFQIQDVPNAESALKMALRGRVDGANVEYNVARYHLSLMNASGQLVAATELPFSNLAFHLSTQKHPEQIQRFNQFLAEQSEAITRLKQQYQLVEFKSQLESDMEKTPK